MPNKALMTAGSIALITVSVYLLSNSSNETASITATTVHSDTSAEYDSSNPQNQTKSVKPATSEERVNKEEDGHSEIYREANIALLNNQEYAEQSQFGDLPSHMRDIAFLPLRFDKDGNFVANANLNAMIEHFLLAAGDEGLDQALARLSEYLSLALPYPASEQAQALADQYLEYKERVASEIKVDENEPNLLVLADQIERMVQKKKDIRRDIMSNDTVDALFSREEALDDFNMTTMRLNLNQDLSYEQRDQLTAQAEQLLPSDIQAKKRYSREKKNLKREVKMLKDQGANEEKIYELRKSFYGQETADRITYFEDFSPEWRQRVDQFNQQKISILNEVSLSKSEAQQQIDYLKASLFSEKEQKKLAVYNIKKRAGQVN